MKKQICVSLFLFLFFTQSAYAFSVGLVSDEHTGTKKNVRTNMAIFQSKIDGIKEKSDIVISCGDEAYNGEKSMYDVMRKMDGIVWVKGDDDKKYDLSAANYTKDFDGVRVIVLDDSKGKLSGSQISFLKNAEQTDKDVIIAMHVPPTNKSGTAIDMKKWKTFFPALTLNVKLVVSGHLHVHRELKWNGIKFIVVPPMFKNNYLIEKI